MTRTYRKGLAEICARNGIVRLRVFGSFARGEESEGSDLDLLADFAGRKTLLDLVRIEREFSERLGVRVDLLTERSLHPKLRDRILDDARVVYERAA
jgi:predicted nucleotidyltransferase